MKPLSQISILDFSFCASIIMTMGLQLSVGRKKKWHNVVSNQQPLDQYFDPFLALSQLP